MLESLDTVAFVGIIWTTCRVHQKITFNPQDIVIMWPLLFTLGPSLLWIYSNMVGITLIVGITLLSNIYHHHMWVGNVFSDVCVSVCVPMFLSVQAITFEPLDVETSFFWYTDTSWTYLGQVWVSRSLGQGQCHMRKMIILLISTC